MLHRSDVLGNGTDLDVFSSTCAALTARYIDCKQRRAAMRLTHRIITCKVVSMEQHGLRADNSYYTLVTFCFLAGVLGDKVHFVIYYRCLKDVYFAL